MKIKITTFFFLTFLLIESQIVSAQIDLKGKITNYQDGSAQLVSNNMFSEEFQSWGSVESDGSFSIKLEPDFLEKVKAKAEEAKKTAPSGFSISFRTAAETFGCTYEEVKNEGGDAVVSGLPELSITDENGNPANGILYAASNSEIANWLYTYGETEAKKGYYLQFYYLESPAKAKGECVLETYTGEGDEMYEEVKLIDLELEQGWNIIRYETMEIFTSKTGKTYPSKITVTRLSELPGDLGWFAIKN